MSSKVNEGVASDEPWCSGLFITADGRDSRVFKSLLERTAKRSDAWECVKDNEAPDSGSFFVVPCLVLCACLNPTLSSCLVICFVAPQAVGGCTSHPSRGTAAAGGTLLICVCD